MRELLLFFCTYFFISATSAQPAEFEGKLVYRTTVRSRAAHVPSALMQKLLFAGDSLMVYVKNGQYRRQTGVLEEFYIPKDEKVYLRFKGIDTLYYREYADDTTSMQSVIKNTGTKKIAGYDCPSITLTTQSDTSLYYYAPPLYANPAHSQKLLLGQLNVLSEQTKAIWLEGETRTGNYVQSSTCIQVLPGKLDEKSFALPQLPVAKFNYTSIFTAPRYAGRGSWAAYIQQNMNLKLVAGSLSLKKKEKAAQQTARVSFVVSENGEVTDVMVTNMKDLHPALAEEAIRLVQKARWSPAVLLNEKLSLTLVQPIVFRAEAE